MNREIEVIEIYLTKISIHEKCKRLEEFLLDCHNEMEAEDENMRPEVKHNLAQAYQLAKNYIRELKQSS